MNLVEKKEPQKVGAGNNKIGNNLKNQPEKGGIGGGKDKNVNIDTEIPSSESHHRLLLAQFSDRFLRHYSIETLKSFSSILFCYFTV